MTANVRKLKNNKILFLITSISLNKNTVRSMDVYLYYSIQFIM